VYVSHDRCNVSRCHKNTDGGLNIDELAIHMAKYQAVLTELQVSKRLRLQKLIMTMGLLQWIGLASVHSANRFQDYSRSLSIVYVSHDGCNVSCYRENTDGGLNIVELATHMAKYQAVLTELQVRVAGNPGGSGENCESQSNLSHLRGGGSETQDGK
jgi:hypothetical protein